MRLFRLPVDSAITVLEARSQGAVALAKSRLDSAGIAYQVRNDYVGDFFGWGRLSGGTNYVTGPVRIAVGPDDADAAKELVGDLAEVRSARIPLAFRLVALILLLVPILGGLVIELRNMFGW